jgi:hypothetical protein
MRPTDSQQVVSRSLISSARNKLLKGYIHFLDAHARPVTQVTYVARPARAKRQPQRRQQENILKLKCKSGRGLNRLKQHHSATASL